MKEPSPESILKMLRVLSERSYRGMEFKSALANQFKMSSETYQNTRNELLRKKLVKRIKIKPQGKNYLYSITKDGKKWLDSNALRTDSTNKISIQRTFPFTLSAKNTDRTGVVELELFAPKTTINDKLFVIGMLSRSPEVNAITNKILHHAIMKDGTTDRDPNYHVDMGLRLSIRTDMPKKLLSSLDLTEKLEELSSRWFVERDLLFELFFDKSLKDKKVSEFLCSVDFFCSRPEALTECFFVSDGVQSIKQNVLGKEHYEWVRLDIAKYKIKLNHPLSLYLFAKFKWPLLRYGIRRDIMKKYRKWIKSEKVNVATTLLWSRPEYPRYVPDYKLKIGRRVFDFSKYRILQWYKDDFVNNDIISWWNDAYEKEYTKMWLIDGFRLRPWEIVSGLSKNKTEAVKRRLDSTISGSERLIDYETFDTNRILNNLTNLINMLQSLQKTDRNKLFTVKAVERGFGKHFKNKNDWELLEAWPYFLDNQRRPPLTIDSLLIKPIQEIYDKWVLAGKPKSNTQYIHEVIKLYFKVLKKSNRREPNLYPKTRNKLTNAIFKIVDEVNFD